MFFCRLQLVFTCWEIFEKQLRFMNMVRNGDSSFLHLLEFHVVRSADPSLDDTKMKLAEIYEILNEPRKALELVYEGIPFSGF
jgi:hypothetical protein